jgi:hypothetical protein
VKSLFRNRWRPSPALIVASLALFISLSGVSYGVATGFIDSREIKNNEVRSVDLRNNDIRTKDLRNNEIRGIDIRNSTVQGRDIALNTVTGEDVKEDTLQKVPSALLADTATKATSADSVSSLKTIPLTTVAEDADPVVLARQGPLTLSGRCDTGSVARLTVSTTETHSAAAANPGSSNPDFDPADGPQEIAQLSAPSPGYAVTSVSAFARSGKSLSGDIALFRDPSGTGSCRFHGHLALEG